MGLLRLRRELSPEAVARRDEIDEEIAVLNDEIAKETPEADRQWRKLHDLEEVRKAGRKPAILPGKHDAELARRIEDAHYSGGDWESSLEFEMKMALQSASASQAGIEKRKARMSDLKRERRALR